ncbi:hypothetical protein BHM03_00031972 [Ensete ventricosum]|nr:hypothetical protein BHM03_00031972 [Ensete ventricosum]
MHTTWYRYYTGTDMNLVHRSNTKILRLKGFSFRAVPPGTTGMYQSDRILVCRPPATGRYRRSRSLPALEEATPPSPRRNEATPRILARDEVTPRLPTQDEATPPSPCKNEATPPLPAPRGKARRRCFVF